jgi:ABC-type bacteriocin/lantibiotic exporter with double-glycine peptidase domain
MYDQVECDFWLRYNNELPWVLTSINIDIAPGEKIGIVGRTGAG